MINFMSKLSGIDLGSNLLSIFIAAGFIATGLAVIRLTIIGFNYIKVNYFKKKVGIKEKKKSKSEVKGF